MRSESRLKPNAKIKFVFRFLTSFVRSRFGILGNLITDLSWFVFIILPFNLFSVFILLTPSSRSTVGTTALVSSHPKAEEPPPNFLILINPSPGDF